MKTQIGIKHENIAAVASGLSKILADEFVIYVKTRNAHWNIEGVDFYSMHKFFEDQYEQLDEIIDQVAERIRAIGHYAPATLKRILALTHLSEESRKANDGQGFIKELLSDHENIIMQLRGDIRKYSDDLNDMGTSDFVTGLMEQHEKMAWMLRAHLN
jgi:starvation-inducible DNA-binding protein